MFTGLVEATGILEVREARGAGCRIGIAAELGELELGESIAVNGACLTVTSQPAWGFTADVSQETLDKTTLGKLEPGRRVNLERSLRVGDRVGGHFVSGHVDGLGRCTSISEAGEALRVRCAAPAELGRFIAAKGSVTLDGVSLTVNHVAGHEFEVMLIPHTLGVTTLGELAPGRELNLEVDLLARYVVRCLESTRDTGADAKLRELLERAGYLR